MKHIKGEFMLVLPLRFMATTHTKGRRTKGWFNPHSYLLAAADGDVIFSNVSPPGN